MIKIKYLPGKLFVRGHAGAGEPGKDIVCAAVSALVCALYNALKDMEEHNEVRITADDVNPGNVTLCWKSRTDGAETSVRYIVRALEDISAKYPENVIFNKGG